MPLSSVGREAGMRGNTRLPPFGVAVVGCALWLPCLLEEGCHSAGFVATIHVRHHLLLSIGWRFNLFAPVQCRKYVTD